MVFQLAGGMAAAFLMLISANVAWTPTVEQSLQQLPDSGGEIRGGRLVWPNRESRLWAERPQLALGVVPAGGAPLGLSSDLQVEFRSDSIWLRGVLGVASLPYPSDLELTLSRTAGPAAWDAWRPALATALGAAAMLVHLSVASALGLVVLLPAWAVSALTRRAGGFGGAAKVSCMAAQAPLLMGWFAVVAYASRAVSLSALGLGLGMVPLLHLVMCGWAIVALPAAAGSPPGSRSRNPFTEQK